MSAFLGDFNQANKIHFHSLTTNIRKRIPQLASLMIHDDKLEERSLNQIFLLANLRTFAFDTPIKDSQPLLIENLR